MRKVIIMFDGQTRELRVSFYLDDMLLHSYCIENNFPINTLPKIRHYMKCEIPRGYELKKIEYTGEI